MTVKLVPKLFKTLVKKMKRHNGIVFYKLEGANIAAFEALNFGIQIP